MSAANLPSTMTGPPVSAYCAPGQCQIKADETTQVPLLERTVVSGTSAVMRFGLPDKNLPLNLSTCSCMLAVAEINGETVVRPYTPISTNKNVGYFDLLVKNYGPEAKMSRHLNEIPVGDTSVSFKHIAPNVKIQATEFQDFDHILMLVGGTGITPMIQALHEILGTSNDKKTVVTVMFGNRESTDILGRELLDQWAKDFPNQLKVHYVLSNEPAESSWKGLRGFVSKDLIAEHFPSPNDETKNLQVWVCGPPPMYNALSGPREEQDKVTGVLGDMGFSSKQVYKF